MAVPEDGDGVRDGENVLEEVGDEDEALAGLLEPPQRREEPLDLGRRQGGGRLVENDDAGPRIEHAAELDQLLEAERQAADRGARIDLDAQAAEMLAGQP